MSPRPLVAIAGSLARKPHQGGHAWALLQWALGFRTLGWEVLWLDRIEPGTCVDERGEGCAPERSENVRYFRELVRAFGLEAEASLVTQEGAGTRALVGPARTRLLKRLGEAELLLNVMGYLEDEELLAAARRRVFLDIDPGFGQMWRALGLADLFTGHHDFVTVGRNLGRPGCTIPDCGLDWIPTWPPVALEHWPAIAPNGGPPLFRSVATWRGRYAPIEFDGEYYGLRAHEFRKFAALPRITGEPFELALDIDPADARDLALLLEGGWKLLNPREVAGDPWSYREFVADSGAEFQVAKQIYVRTRSGWFSDRSACFLASGRPVVMQDTGLAGELPLGEGALAFGTLEEAADAVAEISVDWRRHAVGARRLAEEHLAAGRVVGTLLADLDVEARCLAS